MTTEVRARSAPAKAPAGRDRRRSPARRAQTRFAYTALAPAMILFAVVFAIPIVYAIWLSLFGQRSAGGGAFTPNVVQFVGLENYTDILTDGSFLESARRLGVYVLIMVPAMMFTSILLALLLDLPRVMARSFARTAIFLPYGVPSVIAALMWGFLYVPDISPIYQFAGVFGIEIPNLLRGSAVYSGIANVTLWGGIGFNMVIIYTALQSLPREQIDAARIDGCGEFRIAWYIKLRHVVPATVVTALFSAIGALQAYSEPVMLSTLTTAISSTFFPLMRVYRDAFALDNLNAAAAASIVLALATVLLSLAVLGARQLANRRRSR